MLVLAVIAAAAAGYGWFGESRDYANYVGVYDALTRHDTFSSFRFERGYLYLSWFCKFYIGMDFAQYYTFLAGISLLEIQAALETHLGTRHRCRCLPDDSLSFARIHPAPCRRGSRIRLHGFGCVFGWQAVCGFFVVCFGCVFFRFCFGFGCGGFV